MRDSAFSGKCSVLLLFVLPFFGNETVRAQLAPADLVVDKNYLSTTLSIGQVNANNDPCLINEGCVSGTGLRKVLRFGTMIGNIGFEAFVLGTPDPENPRWHWDECHQHWHYQEYADYQLYDLAYNDMGIGHKNGFCVIDLLNYTGQCVPFYTSCGFQGISKGCADVYTSSLQCQWIDVTGVPNGTYILKVTTNPNGELAEMNYNNNSACARVEMVGNTATYVPYLMGDVTEDNPVQPHTAVTIFDALVIATYSVGLEIPQNYRKRIEQALGNITGPIDGDTDTNIFDSLLIASWSANLPVGEYPIGVYYCP